MSNLDEFYDTQGVDIRCSPYEKFSLTRFLEKQELGPDEWELANFLARLAGRLQPYTNRGYKKSPDLTFDPSNLKHGSYYIYWKSGGRSVATVGSLHDGRRWYAPSNWTSKSSNSFGSIDWESVEKVELIAENSYGWKNGDPT